MCTPHNQDPIDDTGQKAGSLRRVGTTCLFACVLLTTILGCGSSKGSSTTAVGGVVRAVSWKLGANKTGKTIHLSSVVTYCAGSAKPRIQRTDVAEHRDSAVITVFVRFPRHKKSGGEESCADIGLGLQEVLTLRRPITGQTLYDGSTHPPARRWPLL